MTAVVDKAVEEVEKVKKEWEETYTQTQEHIEVIANYGKLGRAKEEKISLASLNAIAREGLRLLNFFLFTLDLLAPQLPSHPEVDSARQLLQSWKTLIQNLRKNLRNANWQAKANLIKADQEEAIYLLFLFSISDKELFFGGGEESRARIRNLQTKAGMTSIAEMTSTAESITESFCRTLQLMVQEVERSKSTRMTLGESTRVLKMAESEYKGHSSSLSKTHNLLSLMQRQHVMDRVILGVCFLLFTLAVLYVLSKRI
ncbi:unnamed protein product [Sphenostylis stenocarpa]|uniref:Sec20 C-terminal domain-containing protein n=1 Tax=Sphenostylis stenocarpa TaxID=92480 RepID=A0AA86VZB7_9FABA|nr:unnamed protein product [Sphenostylis stenocarpa]